MSDIDIDLDALAPREGTTKHNGKVIKIPVPITRDLFEGASLIDKLNEAEDIPTIEACYGELEKFFKRVIPAIEDTLSIYQYKKLYEKMQQLAVPADTKALDDAGISVVSDGEEKKDESNTLEK